MQRKALREVTFKLRRKVYRAISEGRGSEGCAQRSEFNGYEGHAEYVEDQRVQIDHSLKGSVDRLVRSDRDAVL